MDKNARRSLFIAIPLIAAAFVAIGIVGDQFPEPKNEKTAKPAASHSTIKQPGSKTPEKSSPPATAQTAIPNESDIRYYIRYNHLKPLIKKIEHKNGKTTIVMRVPGGTNAKREELDPKAMGLCTTAMSPDIEVEVKDDFDIPLAEKRKDDLACKSERWKFHLD